MSRARHSSMVQTNPNGMRKTHLLTKILCSAWILLCITSCNSDDVRLPENPLPDGTALNELFEDEIENHKQHFTFNASTGGSVTGDQGTILEFNADAFTKLNGDVVTGDVDIELIEIYDRSTMFLTKKPTNGLTGDGTISTLVSGGEFYINAMQNGAQLKLVSGFTIIAPTENTGEIDQDMRLFDGVINCEGNDCDLIWEEQGDRGIEVGEFQTAGGFKTAYYVFQSKFGWTNIDRWYSDPRPKTKIFVDVPEGFDNKNCMIYLAYDGEPTVLASFDMYDADKKLFTEHYGLIPIGLEVHFILVSIIDEEIHYAIQSATIQENHIEVIDEVASITQEDLLDLIDDLP